MNSIPHKVMGNVFGCETSHQLTRPSGAPDKVSVICFVHGTSHIGIKIKVDQKPPNNLDVLVLKNPSKKSNPILHHKNLEIYASGLNQTEYQKHLCHISCSDSHMSNRTSKEFFCHLG